HDAFRRIGLHAGPCATRRPPPAGELESLECVLVAAGALDIRRRLRHNRQGTLRLPRVAGRGHYDWRLGSTPGMGGPAPRRESIEDAIDKVLPSACRDYRVPGCDD